MNDTEIDLISRRRWLPAILGAEDVAVALDVPISTARDWMRGGLVGRTRRIGRRVYVIREEFLAALDAADSDRGLRLMLMRPGEGGSNE